ncbi:glycosyltransferase family 2 protein [Leclercia sp.]|uniref:glycosyltransferase family 2 protein n=1 Tax=Leclercia sp. TaxID=1898428 RepID=UPI0028A842D3|nr:glycosyltransferase family 2 protein [Leclercia sp.]
MRIDSEDLSVIIPAYNEEKNILTILNKLDEQSLNGFRVIVVDDGSVDNTAALVASYKPKQFILHLLRQENKGAARARENAIRVSRSKFIAVIDSDDRLANDSLENAFTPIINDPTIDISLFHLNYVNPDDNEITGSFVCYTANKKLKGKDVFANCVRAWGVHAFGIYNREMFLRAYETYNDINKDGMNYLNNDEVISRISFDLADKIYLSDGNYYFVNNVNSTTRRINHNYYKVLHNAFYILDYIEKNKDAPNYNLLINDAYALIISTMWGVSVRYFKWRKLLSDRDRGQWHSLLHKSISRLSKDKKSRTVLLSKKSKLQLTLLSIMF